MPLIIPGEGGAAFVGVSRIRHRWGVELTLLPFEDGKPVTVMMDLVTAATLTGALTVAGEVANDLNGEDAANN